MKKIIVLLIAVFLYVSSEAQVKLGIMTGISPNHVDVGAVEAVTPDDSLLVSITGPRTVWLFGPYFRLQAGIVYIQSGVMLGFSRVDYEVDDLKTNAKIVAAGREQEWYFDMPIELGVNFYKGFSVTGGVLGTNNFIEERANPLLTIGETFSGIFNGRRFGYRFGVNYDNGWMTSLSLTYNYFPATPSTIIVYNNVEYNSNLRQQQIMVNFSWNLNRKGWE